MDIEDVENKKSKKLLKENNIDPSDLDKNTGATNNSKGLNLGQTNNESSINADTSFYDKAIQELQKRVKQPFSDAGGDIEDQIMASKKLKQNTLTMNNLIDQKGNLENTGLRGQNLLKTQKLQNKNQLKTQKLQHKNQLKRQEMQDENMLAREKLNQEGSLRRQQNKLNNESGGSAISGGHTWPEYDSTRHKMMTEHGNAYAYRPTTNFEKQNSDKVVTTKWMNKY